MTLEQLETLDHQFEEQLAALLAQKVVESEAVRHTNAIELITAKHLMEQLIKQEKVILAKPPGATGPTL